jgi:hypothetical protein
VVKHLASGGSNESGQDALMLAFSQENPEFFQKALQIALQ